MDFPLVPPNPPQEETFWEKGQRKFKEQPLIPLGAAVTVGFLLAGLRSFHQGEKKHAQIMMRGRVVAQGATLLVMAFGAYYGVKPHSRPSEYEQRLNQIHEENASLKRNPPPN